MYLSKYIKRQQIKQKQLYKRLQMGGIESIVGNTITQSKY